MRSVIHENNFVNRAAFCSSIPFVSSPQWQRCHGAGMSSKGEARYKLGL
jgi:hypothetical protein